MFRLFFIAVTMCAGLLAAVPASAESSAGGAGYNPDASNRMPGSPGYRPAPRPGYQPGYRPGRPGYRPGYGGRPVYRQNYGYRPAPVYGYRPGRRLRYGQVCVTSRGNCGWAAQPIGARCRCNISGFGKKRGIIQY